MVVHWRVAWWCIGGWHGNALEGGMVVHWGWNGGALGVEWWCIGGWHGSALEGGMVVHWRVARWCIGGWHSSA